MSKNAVTVEQISIACRNVGDLMAAGMSENLAIRNLEQFANMYAKFRALGHVSPDHTRQYEMWSAKALEAAAANPDRKSGQYLRVEHGTPRRQFARLVLRAFQANQLTQSWLDDLCDAKWRVAVITLDEDRVLARSEYHEDPEARWRAAGIELRSTLRGRGTHLNRGRGGEGAQ